MLCSVEQTNASTTNTLLAQDQECDLV